MKIDIEDFNLKNVQVNPDTVLNFPAGLSGFESFKRYSLFHEEGKPTVFWLQSLDDPNLSFSVVEPKSLDIGYEIELSDEDSSFLDLKDSDETLVLVILYRTEAQDAASGSYIAANTHSPLVLNMRTRLGIQKVLREIHPSVNFRAR